MKIISVKSIHPWQSVIQTNYDIVKADGGKINVESTEGAGCRFVIELTLNHTS